MELPSITNDIIFSHMIILARIGSALMVLPGISESYVSVRIRLIFALAITLLLVPNIQIPKFPENIISLSLMMINEILVGIFIGSITRFLVSATHILGMMIATISGLGSALLYDPTQGAQGAIVGNFLGNITILLLFAGNIHHMLIYGFADSYLIFKINIKANISGMNYEMIHLIGKTFDIAIKLAAPQIVTAVIMIIAGGVLGKLMPAIQIFNLITPVQMLVTFAILMFTLGGSLVWYLENIYDINKSYLFP